MKKYIEKKIINILVPLILFISSFYLFSISSKEYYLWQDEADYALNGITMLESGIPKGLYKGFGIDNMFISTAFPSKDIRYDFQNLKYIRGDKFGNTYQPWLPFIFIGGSIKVLGKTAWAARLPSFIFMALAVVILYFCFKNIMNPFLGLMAALLFATNLTVLSMGKMAYHPSFTYFFLTAILFFTLNSDRSRKQLFLLGLSLIGLLFTHPLIYCFVCISLFPLLRNKQFITYAVLPNLLMFIIFLVTFVPWEYRGILEFASINSITSLINLYTSKVSMGIQYSPLIICFTFIMIIFFNIIKKEQIKKSETLFFLSLFTCSLFQAVFFTSYEIDDSRLPFFSTVLTVSFVYVVGLASEILPSLKWPILLMLIIPFLAKDDEYFSCITGEKSYIEDLNFIVPKVSKIVGDNLLLTENYATTFLYHTNIPTFYSWRVSLDYFKEKSFYWLEDLEFSCKEIYLDNHEGCERRKVFFQKKCTEKVFNFFSSYQLYYCP